MSAQEVTLDRYQQFMQINAQAHLIRAARESGVIGELQKGQATADELIECLNLTPRFAHLLLDAMVAMQVIEKYGDDYALAAVTRLLCQYDADLGDNVWTSLNGQLLGGSGGSTSDYFDEATATQWVHTSAAKQAAEILDIGGERQGRRILDLGCGSAVWSAAMAYADPTASVVAVDTPARAAAAKRTINSIDIGDRYTFVEEEPDEVSLEANAYDLVLIAGRLSGQASDKDRETIERVKQLLKVGGELVLIDLFRGPGKPNINESIEAIRLATKTPAGEIRDAEQMRKLLLESGFAACQFAFIAASRQGWGMLLAVKDQA